MKLSQVAFDAADIMSEKGHCKHALTDLDGRVCFTGAVSAAMLGHPVWYEVARVPLMSEELRAEVMHSFAVLSETATEILVERGLPADGPVRFNNSANTTGEDVILLLKQVGEKARMPECLRCDSCGTTSENRRMAGTKWKMVTDWEDPGGDANFGYMAFAFCSAFCLMQFYVGKEIGEGIPV